MKKERKKGNKKEEGEGVVKKEKKSYYTMKEKGTRRLNTTISYPLHLLSGRLKYDLILPCSQSPGLRSQLFAQINGR